MIHNLDLIESRGTEYTVRKLAGRDELVAKVEEVFGIPRDIVVEAVGELRELRDPWQAPSNSV